jgi:hypothetical protein
MIENRDNWSNMYWTGQYYLGARARMTSEFTGKTEYLEEMDRTRMVLFHPEQSTLFSVVDHEAYKKLMKSLMDEWRAKSGLVAWQAYMDGIDVYFQMNEWRNKPFRAYDGVSWEVWAKKLLPWAAPYTTPYAEDIYALPSGVWCTSLLGVLMALAWFRNQPYAKDIGLIGNSDDMNHVGLDDKPIPPAKMPLDESPMDTKLKFMLGLSFLQAETHPVGVKLTVDKSFRHSPYEDPMSTLFSDYSDIERNITIGMYQGNINNVPMLDYLKMNREVEPTDYFSPSVLLDNVIQYEIQKQEGL